MHMNTDTNQTSGQILLVHIAGSKKVYVVNRDREKVVHVVTEVEVV
jgi:hypothetical protein